MGNLLFFGNYELTCQFCDLLTPQVHLLSHEETLQPGRSHYRLQLQLLAYGFLGGRERGLPPLGTSGVLLFLRREEEKRE